MNFTSLLFVTCIAAFVVVSAPGASSLTISQLPYWGSKRTVESDGQTLNILPLDEQTEEAAGKDLVCVGERCALWPKELTALVSNSDMIVESVDLNDAESPESNQESKRDIQKLDINKSRTCLIRSQSGFCLRWV